MSWPGLSRPSETDVRDRMARTRQAMTDLQRLDPHEAAMANWQRLDSCFDESGASAA